jgi:dTDP-glucose pyrophosphorylase
MNILIPAAGKGSRFKLTHKSPKPLINVDGEPMLVRAAKSVGIKGNYIFILNEFEQTQELANKLFEAFPKANIAVIDFETEGAAETALVAEDLINNDQELLIVNCDQILNWSYDIALKQLRKYDAGLVVIESSEPKHSYVDVINNLAIKVAEKQVISNFALTGIHYWKRGSDFVKSVRSMILNNDRTNNEFYIGPCYNYFIEQGNKVAVYKLNPTEIHFIGTPEDLKLYEDKKTK